MSELIEAQENYSTSRKQLAEVNSDLQKAKAELDNLLVKEKQEFRGLDNQTREERNAFNEIIKKELSSQIGKLSSERKSLVAQLGELSVRHQKLLDPINTTNELNDAFPILMFPLRLETRFKSTGSQQQLWLRVYPDDCNINRKEGILSDSELSNAKSFWIEMWKAASIEVEERGAWRSLVNSHGSGRSAWIIEQYKPTNNKPSKTDAKYKVLVVISLLNLSDIEHLAARDYWAAVWLARGNQELLDNAFITLKSAVGEAKANEILEKYSPENITDKVPADILNDMVLLEKLELPAPENYTTKRISWTQAPKAIALPDRFVAIAYTGTLKRTILFDRTVKENLSVGPDPSLDANEQIKKDTNDDLIINEDLTWMVDFEKAVEAGMGVKINLTSLEAVNGFDKLFVVGLRITSNETESKEQLEKLITDHFHSKDGFGIVKQGTPSNNTEDEPAGYSWLDNAEESYDRVIKHIEDFEDKDDFAEKSDGQKLAESLGIDPNLLKKVPNANGRDHLEAKAMNTALFPATLGYFLEEMMHPLFSESDIEATRLFFSNFVSGRGPLPGIRIGKQPYGILPVSVYSKLEFQNRITVGTHVGSADAKTPYLSRLHSLLMKMDVSWDELLPQVAFVGKTGDPHQILLDVIGLHANTVEFHQRYAQSTQLLYNKLTLQLEAKFAEDISDAIAETGKDILEKLNIDIGDIKLPILEKYFLSQPNLLSGPLVDDLPNSEINPIRAYSADGKNYIEWLSVSDGEKIRTENFGGNPSPNALLYLLLRHALIQAQADATTQILITNALAKSKKEFYDPDFIHIQKNSIGKSKFEHMYSTNSAITGSNDLKLIDYLYEPAVLRDFAATKQLRETIDALKILQKTPTARLERLLVEHLDCCNYRIDAWKTGFVDYKLLQQRSLNQIENKPSKGLYLGAYGWLLDVKPENKILTNVNLSAELNEIFNKGNSSPLQTDSKNLGYIHTPSLNQAATAAILRNAYDSNKSSGSGNPFAINLTSDRVRIANSFLEGMRNGQSLSSLLGYQFERGLHDKHNLGQGEADKFIYPLRKVFPLVADNLKDTKSDPSDSIEAIQANNVIDGLKLMNHVYKSSVKTYPFGLPAMYNLPVADATQAKAINDEVKRIIEIHDSISDLVISEQVYQVVQGNYERVSGNAEAFSKGSYPPDIDIMNTPRSGNTLTQRMAIQFDAGADPTTSPNSVAMTPKAAAEPCINKWLSSILPAPENVLCKVTYSSPIKTDDILVSQKDLGLQSIDLLYTFNLDTEQAMTELDDRISNYVSYTISKHPKTDIKINYTEFIDEFDKSKISFFELAALVKSLRKILIGSKILSPAEVTLSTAGQQQISFLDDVFRIRITDLKTDFVASKTSIETILSNTISFSGLTESLKTLLNPHISDVSKVESLLSQFKSDLKVYAADPSSSNKARILTAFEESVQSIGNSTTINTLKSDYETKLNAYETDLANFDQLTENTINSFLNLAFYDNTQTGTGFIHQGILGVYDSTFSKLDKVIERWEKKKLDYNAVIAGYNPAGIAEVQFELLQKAERIISSQSTFPIPTTLISYKLINDNKKSDFDIVLTNLKSLKTNSKVKVTDFIVDVEIYIQDMSNHDVVSFDIENERNDLKAEKLKLVSLKEDILVALENLKTFVADKITSFDKLMTEADGTIINNDKITALQNAAKKILGEEALLLPHFKLSGAQANEFESSYTNSEDLLTFLKVQIKEEKRKIFPVEDWLGGVSRVREKVHHWENASFLSNAFNPGSMLELTPLQFPYQADDRWVAMKFRDEEKVPADEFQINNDKLLYTAHFAAIPFDKTKPLCGIVIDEWTEVVPSNEETTGIGFHYDQPNNEPPQTMLLVTPPDITGSWKWDDIIESMEETLQMAKKRAIEPSQIEKTGYAQFLPSTMMAVTLYWITVATNLAINNNIYQRIEKN